MLWTRHNPAKRWSYNAVALLVTPLLPLWAQKTPQAAPPTPAVSSTPGQGTVIDRVVAVVNGSVILESDVDEELRFVMIQPYLYRAAGEATRQRALQRLIDRTLIQDEAARQPGLEVTEEELDEQLANLRKDIPACKEYHCETEAGWQRFLAKYGFTETEFRDRWRTRMELLRFVEVRFGSGIQVTDDQIRDYYEKTMLPEYRRQNVTPPGLLDAIKQRIAEVLLQQQVGNLLRDWLNSLRAQGSVRIIGQDEVSR